MGVAEHAGYGRQNMVSYEVQSTSKPGLCKKGIREVWKMLEASKLCNITGSSCLMAWCHMGFLSGMTPFYNTLSTAWVFHLYFSAPLPAWRNLFSATGIFCDGRYQPGCTGIFWLAEGTCHYFLKVKKSQLCFTWKRTWVTCPSVIFDLF